MRNAATSWAFSILTTSCLGRNAGHSVAGTCRARFHASIQSGAVRRWASMSIPWSSILKRLFEGSGLILFAIAGALLSSPHPVVNVVATTYNALPSRPNLSILVSCQVNRIPNQPCPTAVQQLVFPAEEVVTATSNVLPLGVVSPIDVALDCNSQRLPDRNGRRVHLVRCSRGLRASESIQIFAIGYRDMRPQDIEIRDLHRSLADRIRCERVDDDRYRRAEESVISCSEEPRTVEVVATALSRWAKEWDAR